MVALVTVIYGTNPLYELELFASVLSALSYDDSKEISITVYTDKNLDNFPLPINVVQFDPAEWNEWTYNGVATHFVKMHVMLRMLQSHQCPVLYFDTDVVFLRSPVDLCKHITHNSSVMHAYEGLIQEHTVWQKFLSNIDDYGDAFVPTISAASPMYNSGIMGLLPQHADKMERAITLAVALYKIEPIFSIDQFATGTILSTESSLVTCETSVFHYWGWRRKFIHLSLEALRSNWGSSTQKSQLCFDSLLSQPTPHPVDRVISKLTYLFSPNSKYAQFAYLAFLSAKRNLKHHPDISQAWLRTSLEFAEKILRKNINAKMNNKNYDVITENFSYLINSIKKTPSLINQSDRERIENLKDKQLDHRQLD